MAFETDIHMEFPDERGRKDFETAFKGWVTQWQTQQLILRRLIESTATEEEKKEVSAGLVPNEKHRLGFEAGPAGLLTIEDVTLSYGDFEIEIGDIYLNIIPFI